MRQSRGIRRIKGLIIVFFSLTLVAHSVRAQEIELWGYGPVLDDEKVQEALMLAVDWPSLTGSIFKDPYIPVVLYPQEGEPLDNLSLEFDPERAAELLEEVGYSEKVLQLALVYVADFNLALLAGAIADDLGQLKNIEPGQLNIEVTPFEASSEDELYELEVYLANEVYLNALVLELGQ